MGTDSRKAWTDTAGASRTAPEVEDEADHSDQGFQEETAVLNVGTAQFHRSRASALKYSPAASNNWHAGVEPDKWFRRIDMSTPARPEATEDSSARAGMPASKSPGTGVSPQRGILRTTIPTELRAHSTPEQEHWWRNSTARRRSGSDLRNAGGLAPQQNEHTRQAVYVGTKGQTNRAEDVAHSEQLLFHAEDTTMEVCDPKLWPQI